MDNLKLDAIGLRCYAKALYSELSPIWTKMAGITVSGSLFNAS